MKATLLVLLFAIISSSGLKPNLRFLRTIAKRVPMQPTPVQPIDNPREIQVDPAQEFYDYPIQKYKPAKEYFEQGSRFDNLMEILQKKTIDYDQAYVLCGGYSPIDICQEFVKEIADRIKNPTNYIKQISK